MPNKTPQCHTAAVIGASGFIGSAVVSALESRGVQVIRVRAPRVVMDKADGIDSAVKKHNRVCESLAESITGAAVVINAAGNPNASEDNSAGLKAVNGVLPGIIATAATLARVPRMVHISSAAVQGAKPLLDESQTYDGFSPYAVSKIHGEQAALRYGNGNVVVYRPPSVHGADRRVTRLTARFAASPLATISSPASSPTPQTLLVNVGDAVLHLALSDERPPEIVLHPWEGLTTSELLSLLGNKRPLTLPRWFCRGTLGGLSIASGIIKRFKPYVRRLELVWFGQAQSESWLTASGWSPIAGRSEWEALGRGLRENLKKSWKSRQAN